MNMGIVIGIGLAVALVVAAKARRANRGLAEEVELAHQEAAPRREGADGP